jgi:hypothetical protein
MKIMKDKSLYISLSRKGEFHDSRAIKPGKVEKGG